MRISSYNALLRRLRLSRLAPCTALFYVDLHGVRHLNRSGNPALADQVIGSVGAAITDWASGMAGIGLRLWSNEFVAAKAIDHPQAAMDEAQALRELLLSLPLSEIAGNWRLAVSIGVACARPGGDLVPVLQQAALACDKAKRRGINQIVPSSGPVREEPSRLSGADHTEAFSRALSAGELTMHAQPIYDIQCGRTRLAKAEFLIRRLYNGTYASLPPGMIESLEAFGMVTQLDRFSSSFILAWLEENSAAMDRLESVSINLSAKSVADGDFMYKLFNDVRSAHLPRGVLSFEITETTAVEHLDVASEAIDELRTLGCTFSLDDFGSGLCSFGYLQSLPVDEVKIDGRFVRGIAQEKPWREIVNAIREVAHATGKKTVAEFVDEPAKLHILREIGVDYAQGYLFSPAIPPEDLIGLLEGRPMALELPGG